MDIPRPEDVTAEQRAELAAALRRRAHVRGDGVAISLFRDAIPPEYEGRSVEPCAILRHAMDGGERVYVDADHHACLAGAWQAGFLVPPEPVATGRYLFDNMPYFTEAGARAVKSGENVLPQGLLRGIGAAPLDAVPDGVGVDWFAVVCEPLLASTIGGVRCSIDGVPPRGAAGTSLCGDLFALPYHDRNVVISMSDMGGRMFNKLKPTEMVVVVPIEYAPHLVTLLTERPDLNGLLEAIKPGYVAERDAKLAARRGASEPTEPTEPAAEAIAEEVLADAEGSGATTMPWDDEPRELLAQAPPEIREFAVPTLEAYALEHGNERITIEVMAEQMASIGMDLDDVREMLR